MHTSVKQFIHIYIVRTFKIGKSIEIKISQNMLSTKKPFKTVAQQSNTCTGHF